MRMLTRVDTGRAVCVRTKVDATGLKRQKLRLLNTAHFHVVFTIPHEYLTLWRYNERLMTQILFRSAQETLLQLMGDENRHGVMPGLLVALHTWGRQLNPHPHLHCVVTAGGITAKGDWRDTVEYLLPGTILRNVFRGKFQRILKASLETRLLGLPPAETEQAVKALHRALYKKDWNVRVEERYAHGKGVVVYLARYCRGSPVHPRQLTRISVDEAVMRYLDHRTGHIGEQRLPPERFVQQLLQHVAPTGQHTFATMDCIRPEPNGDMRRQKRCMEPSSILRLDHRHWNSDY